MEKIFCSECIFFFEIKQFPDDTVEMCKHDNAYVYKDTYKKKHAIIKSITPSTKNFDNLCLDYEPKQ